MAKNKTAAESAGETLPAKIPQPHGGALYTGGVPGNNGGRPPDEFKRAMRALASNDEMLRHVQTVLNDPDHPQWLGAWKWAVERGYGKEVQAVDVNVEGEIVLDLRVPKPEDE